MSTVNLKEIKSLAEKIAERSNPELKWAISRADTGQLARAMLAMLPIVEAAIEQEKARALIRTEPLPGERWRAACVATEQAVRAIRAEQPEKTE